MMNFINELKEGTVVLVKEGKGKRPVAFTFEGKVILFKNSVKLGFARITSIIDKGNCFLCEAENIVKDYYQDIPYEEFLEVLKLKEYKIGFDIPFKYKEYEERQLLAYNLDYNTIIIANTFKGNFNSINVYCPNLPIFTFFRSLFSHGGGNLSVLELCHSGNISFPLECIHEEMEKVKKEKGVKWAESEDISLWTYADPSTDKDGNWILWESTIDRVLLADKEIEKILGNSKRMKPIFAKRKEV